MAFAGYNATVSIATGASGAATFAALDGAMSVSLSDSNDTHDITDLADGRLRRRIVGLRDLTMTIDGDVERTDSAYVRVKESFAAGSNVYVLVTADGTNGVYAPFVIASFDRSASVDGKVEMSISLEVDGSEIVEVGGGV